jgi:hypothetical protein
MTIQQTPATPADPSSTPPSASGPAQAPTPAPAPVAARRRGGRMLDLALAGAAVVAIAGVAFAAGRATAPATAAANGFAARGGTFFRDNGSFDPGSGQGPRFAFGGGGGRLAIDGTVTAVDATSITIKSADGQERTFDLDPSTRYHRASDAAASDVSVGDDVSVKVSSNARGQGQAPSASGQPTLSASDVTLTH